MSKTRIHADSSSDITNFYFKYPAHDNYVNIYSSCLYPDSSYNFYIHTGDYEEDSEYKSLENVMTTQKVYDCYFPLNSWENHTNSFKTAWQADELLDLQLVKIGTVYNCVDSIYWDIVKCYQCCQAVPPCTTKGCDSIMVPVIFNSTIYNEDEQTIYTSHNGFNTHTGMFANSHSNGISDSIGIVWNNVTNQMFLTYMRMIDTTGTYPETSTVVSKWDITESELDSVISIRGNDSLITSYLYDNYGNQTHVISPTGDTLYYEYNSADSSAFLKRAYSSVYGDFYKMAYHFNVGAIRWQISANGDTTFYYYDSSNRQTSVKKPLEQGSWTAKSVYDEANRTKIDSVRTGTNSFAVSKSIFNEFHWPVKSLSEKEIGNILSHYEYDNMGRVYRTSKPDTSSSDTVWSELVYDRLGRVVKAIYPGGAYDSTVYNPLSSETIDRLGRKKKTVLNQYLQVEKVFFDSLYQDSIVFEYGPGGKVVKETDPRGMTKKYWYDQYGRLYSDSSADKGQKYYYYDKSNNLRFAKDANGTWIYHKYDELGREIEMGMVYNPDTTEVDDPDYPTSNTREYVINKYHCCPAFLVGA